MTEPWETPDPDLIQDTLATLSVCSGTAADVVWHLLVDIDPAEVLAVRRKQKMQLARYARQSLLQWDDVEVNEIRAWISVLKEILDTENAVTNHEDR